jgi:hypothetical protein
MSTEEFVGQYGGKSNVALLLIASNDDHGYSSDAVQAAMSILSSRMGSADIQKLWSQELSRLEDLSERCILCHNEKVANIADSVPGLLALAVVGIGYTRKKYSFRPLDFNLCPRCLSTRGKPSHEGGKPKILWEDYYRHPLCEFYMSQGFSELRYGDEAKSVLRSSREQAFKDYVREIIPTMDAYERWADDFSSLTEKVDRVSDRLVNVILGLKSRLLQLSASVEASQPPSELRSFKDQFVDACRLHLEFFEQFGQSGLTRGATRFNGLERQESTLEANDTYRGACDTLIDALEERHLTFEDLE